MPGSELVTLKGGVVVPLPAIWVALDLEARGCRFDVDGDGGLLVRPAAALTPADRVAIAKWKPELVTLTAYCLNVKAVM